MRLADLPAPDTAATRAAEAVLHRYAGPALVNHAVRSWLLAAALGLAEGIRYDAELLRVGALLHDIGLEDPFDSHRLPFEEAGGHLAWVLAAGAGWEPARRDRVGQVVVRHMWPDVDPAVDPESHLLSRSTGIDISGRRVDDVPAELVAEVLAVAPRLDLATAFAACFDDQAARKPDSNAAAAVRGGIAGMLRANPLEGPGSVGGDL